MKIASPSRANNLGKVTRTKAQMSCSWSQLAYVRNKFSWPILCFVTYSYVVAILSVTGLQNLEFKRFSVSLIVLSFWLGRKKWEDTVGWGNSLSNSVCQSVQSDKH